MMKTTNYYNTFIEIAEDCPVTNSETPPKKGDLLTIANIQFDMISKNPYKFTSDEILFHLYALKNNIKEVDLQSEKEKFFSKGQPCFRSSPLTKRYGWGLHRNSLGRIALIAKDSNDYLKFQQDKNTKILKAMRSKKV